MTTDAPPSSPRLSRRSLLIAAAGVPAVAVAAWAGTRGGPSASSNGTLAAASPVAFGPVPSGFQRLRAAPAMAALQSGAAVPTSVWAYEATTPGPEIRTVAGGRVRARLENGLPQTTAVHWHGISIDNAMDGVPGLTQDSIAPGSTFDYDFVTPHPGTYWYHTHDRSWEQNARGLHGPLIVEESEPYPVDRDVTLMVEDWRLGDDGSFDEDSLGSLHEWSHDGRMGNVLTVNGQEHPTIEVEPGERLRVRLVNTANARIIGVDFGDLPATLIALDGHPATPRPVEDYVLLAPAQRADVVVDIDGEPGATRQIQLLTQNGPLPGVALAVGPGSRLRTDFPDVPALPDRRPRPVQLDIDRAVHVDLLMEGGAMGGMRRASLGGTSMDAGELADEQRFWAFNGVAGDLDQPIASLQRGSTAIVAIRNDTVFPHAMHLHGHHFQVLRRNGRPDPTQDWRDTELLAGGEEVEIAFVADNPGKWLLHCHMLEHAVAGMATWLDVA